jgi:hypothetical protein
MDGQQTLQLQNSKLSEIQPHVFRIDALDHQYERHPGMTSSNASSRLSQRRSCFEFSARLFSDLVSGVGFNRRQSSSFARKTFDFETSFYSANNTTYYELLYLVARTRHLLLHIKTNDSTVQGWQNQDEPAPRAPLGAAHDR